MLSTKCKQNVQTTINHLAGVWMYGVGKVVGGKGKQNKKIKIRYGQYTYSQLRHRGIIGIIIIEMHQSIAECS